MGYLMRGINEELDTRERRKKAPDIVHTLLKDTRLPTDVVNDLVKGYVGTGKMELPKVLGEGVQGPLEKGQIRESADVSVRPRIFRQNASGAYEALPAGITERSQIVTGKEQMPGETVLYTKDGKGGYTVVRREPSQNSRWIDVTPKQQPAGRGASPAEIKARQGLEAVASQLRFGRKATIAGTTEPIADRASAQDVAIIAGVDPERYPEIMALINKYPETPAEPEKGPSFFNRAAESLAGGARKIAGAFSGAGSNKPSYAPVQPRKQNNALYFNTLEEAQSANVPRGTIIWIGNRRAVVE